MIEKKIDEFRQTNRLKNTWLVFRKDKIALFSFYILILLLILALFGTSVAPYSANQQFTDHTLMPPSWAENGKIAFFLGTDDIGRDIFSRIIIGSRYTFGAAIVVIIITTILGSFFGILSGMTRGAKSTMIGHFFDAFLSIPILLIAIIIATLMQPSLINAMLATTLALLPHFIHVIYKAIQQELKEESTLMLHLDGAPNFILLKNSILPKISITFIKEVTRAFIIAILDISILSFISLGAQQPVPEWGAMVRDALELIYIAPWALVLPGLAIVFAISAITLFSNGLCKAIDKYM